MRTLVIFTSLVFATDVPGVKRPDQRLIRDQAVRHRG
jgi:hypothetical protein